MSGETRRAFVIMPFAEGFDEVYNLFIADTLASAGYGVLRADDIRAQQNILKDILLGIANAHLVVADLTDSNPNVYYELGIAHALRRPVILLTQRLEDLPFDLRSYRVISYSTHFAEINRARERLFELAKGASDGTVPFGNPVTDFLGPSLPALGTGPEPDAEAGLLDHLVAVEDSFASLTQIVAEYGTETSQVGVFTNEVNERLPSLVRQGSIRGARTLVMGLAQKLSSYAEKVSAQNERYTNVLGDLRTALEFVLRSQSPVSEEEVTQLRTLLQTLSQVEENAAAGRTVTSGLAETLRNLPNVERTFGRARDRTVRELNRFAENIEQTVATIARAREIGESKLPPEEGAV